MLIVEGKMEIHVNQASMDDKIIIQNLLQLHLHDLSTITGVDASVGGTDVNEHGLFDYHHLDLYWVDQRGFPYLIRVDGRIAGFALIYKHSEVRYSITEFFVLRKYRRKGVGTHAILHILELFPGVCEITYSNDNGSATGFWKNVAQRFPSEKCHIQQTEKMDWRGNILRIET